MWKARIFDFTLFAASLIIVYFSGHIIIETDTFVKSLIIFWLFSCLYYNLRIFDNSGQTSIDYGINFALSFGIFTGPLGLFIYEFFYHFTVYLYKVIKKKRVGGDFLDIFYNIGAFTTAYSIAYYLYQAFSPTFHSIPFGFWILICLLAVFTLVLTDIFLTIVFFILGEFKTIRDAIDWQIRSRTIMDMGKVAFTNGLLLLLLHDERWDMIICLFLLNYFVSGSFFDKSQLIRHKMERDQFERMAYTDFLTGISNRALMDKKIAELNETDECIGVVVADIDKFKQINDNYNHAVGDQVIQNFVHTVKNHLNEEDYLFRSGGEEFTFFLRNRNFEDCVNLVENLKQDVETYAVEVDYNSEMVSLFYTASFGLYYFKINNPVSMEKGYIYADNLLLESKQRGRNKIMVKNMLVDQELMIK